jgi:uncharacterized RDD family membrane protein YckC
LYCSKCGNTLADTAPYCDKCGQATYAAPLVATSGAGLAVAAAPVSIAPRAPARAYAGFWLRFVAYLIDAIILGIFAVPILIGTAMLMGLGTILMDLPHQRDPFENGLPPAIAGFIALCGLVGIVGKWLYHALLESSEWQATLGKRIMGLEVTDMAGARVTFARATGRHFGKLITYLIPLFIGYILAGFTEKRQALHDMLASCLVLRKA